MLARMYNWLRQIKPSSMSKSSSLDVRIEGACKQTGKCCQNLILVDNGRPIRTQQDFDALVQRVAYNAMFVPREKTVADGFLRFSCRNLTAEHRCGIYESRPEICRRYPEPEMMNFGGGLLPGCGYSIPQKKFGDLLDEELKKKGADTR